MKGDVREKNRGVCFVKRPWLVVCLLLLQLLLVSRTGLAGGTPVILIHGSGADPENTWGYHEPSGFRGFASYLRDNGYVPGVTLFAMDYSHDPDPDYAVLYHSLADQIAWVKEVSGSDEVDLVSHGMGGIIARYYINSDRYRQDVRTLVMLGTPNWGLVAASPAKAACYLTKTTAPSHSTGGFPGGLAFADARAREAYDLLYQDYMVENEFGPGKWSSFEHWFLEARREQYEKNILNAQVPPEPPGYSMGSGFPPGSPREGTDLTRAHYEMLAMAMAQDAYRRSAIRVPGLVDTLLANPPLVVPDVKTLLAHYGALTAKWIVTWAAREMEIPAKSRLLGWAEEILGFPFDGVAADRLLTVRESFPRIVQGGRPGGRVLVNHFLEHLNREEATGRQGVRYVSFAGKALEVWSRFWPGIGPNDLWVEVSSAFLPLERDDLFRVYTGPFLNHGWLTSSPVIWEATLKQLRAFPRPMEDLVVSRGVLGLGRAKGGGYASVWEPQYHSLRVESPGELHLEIWAARQSVRVGQGLELNAWYRPVISGKLGEAVDVVLDLEEGLVRGSVVIDGLGNEVEGVLLGFRASSPLLGPESLPDFSPESCLRYDFLALLKEGGSHEIAAEPPEAAPPPEEPSEVPSIIVQRVTKHTTLKQEDVASHARWEWDFGDGTGFVDDDPSQTVSMVSKVFDDDGRYQVTAKSLDRDGKVLREMDWDVEVKAGEDTSFTAETPLPPHVDIEIEGPLEWITGRPARFHLRATVVDPPQGHVVNVGFHPGEQFDVTWVRPGRYEVQGAVTVRVRYEFPERPVTLSHTYLQRAEVEVLATSVQE